MDHIIKRQAFIFREKHQLKKYAAIDLYALLKTLKVITVFLPCGEISSISGMALKTANHRFMMINSDKSIGRQHFTIYHELYHLFEQEDFISETTSNRLEFNKKDKTEYAADLFAMYLMMPEETIYSKIPEEELEEHEISLKTIFEIERDLKCSHSALLYRLLNLNIIKKDKYEKLKNIELKNEVSKLGFDLTLYSSGNKNRIIGDYQELAENAFGNEKISESHYISLLQDIFIES